MDTNTAASSSATEKVVDEVDVETLKKSEKEEAQAILLAAALEYSRSLAAVVDKSVGARKAVPIRNSFVRNDDPTEDAPLNKLVSGGGGRGAAVPVMLYVALIWKCAKKPFSVKLSARQWAGLLGLPDAPGKGARRIANALQRLEDLNLIKLDKAHGEVSTITLLDESGDGSDYGLPSTAYSKGGLKRDLYFKVSSKLWTSGKFQQLSAPGLAMLLILQEEGGHKPSKSPFKVLRASPQGSEVWFTTENFPTRYGISASMRSRGTAELIEACLLETTRRPVGPPGNLMSFTTEKLRKVYTLQGEAVVVDKETEVKGAKALAKKTAPKAKPSANKEGNQPLTKLAKK
ncbi:hypothetical protein [Paeniglutamicibacter cryotolerans]|uniref:Uncharacterized protein n=1 Tax=Paeniglutamicibacter cryotolerans TaxID=670079 RepID=A0A839QPL5_9MICC|nr:hypothetical protein [Paeniglutamicibacter cryotolerans]MBB2997680.1 hypothetical protein [Paeniglutamicibacter cryotolerans]